MAAKNTRLSIAQNPAGTMCNALWKLRMGKGHEGEEAQGKLRGAVQKSQRGSKAADLQTSHYF